MPRAPIPPNRHAPRIYLLFWLLNATRFRFCRLVWIPVYLKRHVLLFPLFLSFYYSLLLWLRFIPSSNTRYCLCLRSKLFGSIPALCTLRMTEGPQGARCSADTKSNGPFVSTGKYNDAFCRLYNMNAIACATATQPRQCMSFSVPRHALMTPHIKLPHRNYTNTCINANHSKSLLDEAKGSLFEQVTEYLCI